MKKLSAGLLVAFLAVSMPTELMAQAPATVEIEPSALELKVGESIQLKAVVKDADGNVLPEAQVLFFGPRLSLDVTPGGYVTAIRPGEEHRVVALSPEERIEGDPDYYTRSFEAGIRGKLDIFVPEPPLASIEILEVPDTIYAGTTTRQVEYPSDSVMPAYESGQLSDEDLENLIAYLDGLRGD